MSSSTTGFTEEGQLQAAQTPLNTDYILTEEKIRMLKECQKDSFFYMSGPLSLLSMTITQTLVSKGILSASPRFGPLPKIFFAGICGFLTGKLLYLKICQEKFQRLKNSPVGEMVRQRSQGPQSELSDPDAQSFEPVFQSAEALSHMSSYNKDYGHGYSPDPPAQMDKGDSFSAPVQSYVEEEEPKRKSVLYEDLRLKNRENYEVMLTQKADALLKPPPTKEPERPKKEMKNVYGDTWEE